MPGTKAVSALKVREKRRNVSGRDYAPALQIDANVTLDETENFIGFLKATGNALCFLAELPVCHKISGILPRTLPRGAEKILLGRSAASDGGNMLATIRGS